MFKYNCKAISLHSGKVYDAVLSYNADGNIIIRISNDTSLTCDGMKFDKLVVLLPDCVPRSVKQRIKQISISMKQFDKLRLRSDIT